MKELFTFPLKQFLFWTIYFFLIQCSFILFFNYELAAISLNHILLTFYKALALNFAAAAYLTVLSFLLYFISGFFKTSIFQKINFYFILIAIFVCFIINSADFALYQNWGTKINGKAIWYLKFSDSSNTVKGYYGFIKYAIAIFTISIAATYFYFKYLKKINPNNSKLLNKISGFLLIIFILFYAIRGGLTGRPVDKGSAFYSKHSVLNYAAINGFWNFFDILSNFKNPPKQYDFFTKKEIEKYNLFDTAKQNKSFTTLSNLKKPNIIFIFLESWNADVVGCMGGLNRVTPYFDKLINDGIIFNNFYSTGFRTEQGLLAALSGFPAQAQTYPMLDFERFDNYPNIIKELAKKGYYTSYFTGGNPHFANTDVYLTSSGIDKINKDLLFTAKRKSAWGALDEEGFDYLLNGIEKQKQPFFTTMVTITSHEWFEADVPQVLYDKDAVSARYKNTVRYTDSCLFDFISKAKQKEWYKNTLIFIMADHSCTYPLYRNMNEPLRYRIPFLICGGALKKEFRNTANNSFGSHLNIPSIICNETDANKDYFNFSENLIPNNENSFAYFAYDHGFGIIENHNLVVWDCNLNKIISSAGDKKTINNLLKKGMYIMQYSEMLKDDYQIKKGK